MKYTVIQIWVKYGIKSFPFYEMDHHLQIATAVCTMSSRAAGIKSHCIYAYECIVLIIPLSGLTRRNCIGMRLDHLIYYFIFLLTFSDSLCD